MKIFATFLIGEDKVEIYRIGTNPKSFSEEKYQDEFYKESELFFQDINTTTDPNLTSWIPYNGYYYAEIGYINPDTNEFYNIESITKENSSNLIYGERVEIYKDGNLIETKFESFNYEEIESVGSKC